MHPLVILLLTVGLIFVFMVIVRLLRANSGGTTVYSNDTNDAPLQDNFYSHTTMNTNNGTGAIGSANTSAAEQTGAEHDSTSNAGYHSTHSDVPDPDNSFSGDSGNSFDSSSSADSSSSSDSGSSGTD